MDSVNWSGLRINLTHLCLGCRDKYGSIERVEFLRKGSIGLWIGREVLTED